MPVDVSAEVEGLGSDWSEPALLMVAHDSLVPETLVVEAEGWSAPEALVMVELEAEGWSAPEALAVVLEVEVEDWSAPELQLEGVEVC